MVSLQYALDGRIYGGSTLFTNPTG
jgi:hypothetical protein